MSDYYAEDVRVPPPPGQKLKARRKPVPPAKPPARGDHIVITWPGGPHNFRMEFLELDASMPAPEPGWFWLHGKVGETKLGLDLVVNDWRTLYARPIADGVYEMVPRGG